MHKRQQRWFCTLICATLMLVSVPVFAQQAKLTNIIVTNTRDDFLVYLAVEGAFREKMKKAILSGVPTTFSFFITLYQSRNMWLDKKIADVKITHTIKYDNLKNEFNRTKYGIFLQIELLSLDALIGVVKKWIWAWKKHGLNWSSNIYIYIYVCVGD